MEQNLRTECKIRRLVSNNQNTKRRIGWNSTKTGDARKDRYLDISILTHSKYKHSPPSKMRTLQTDAEQIKSKTQQKCF